MTLPTRLHHAVGTTLVVLVLSGAIHAGPPTSNPGENAASAERPRPPASALRYEYSYTFSFGIPVGTLPEDCGLPAELTAGDSRVHAICAEGRILVQCDGKQLFIRNETTRATGLLLGGGEKPMQHRIPAVTEHWLFGDGSVATTTRGNVSAGPADYTLVIDEVGKANSMLTLYAIPGQLAGRFSLKSAIPVRRAVRTEGRDAGSRVNCDDLVRVDLEPREEGTVAYQTRVPMNQVVAGDVPEGAESVGEYVEDAETGLPLEMQAFFEYPSGSRGEEDASTRRIVPTATHHYKWTRIGELDLPERVVCATSPQAIALIRQGALPGEGRPIPPGLLVLNLESKADADSARDFGGIPVLPDTAIIQDNTASPPRIIDQRRGD